MQPADAVGKYVGEVYIQHNPGVGNGKQAFIEYFTRMEREYPGKDVHFKRAIAEGNYVVLHCHKSGRATVTGPASTSSGSMTTAKSSNNWDVLQTVPETSSDGNTMF